MVNSAGLYADEVAALLGKSQLPHLSGARRICGGGARPSRSGERAGLSAAASRQAKPGRAPDARRCGARCWLGRRRDTWRTRPTTSTTGCRSRSFSQDARGLLPELHLEDLRLAYSGLRPKLVPPSGHGMADFVITRDPTYPRAIHLVGIESPGLTSAPAIARARGCARCARRWINGLERQKAAQAPERRAELGLAAKRLCGRRY